MEGSTHRYRTVVVSDIHLGIKDSKVNEVIDFLKAYPADRLILNGDIIDGWRLKKTGRWRKKHTRFFKYLIKISLKTEIIYVKGNHDDFLDHIAPFGFLNFRILHDYVFTSANGSKYLVIHGDIFDVITKHLIWLSKFGASGYDLLLWLNRLYNRWREKRGLPYKSISKEIKDKVKIANSIISNFETKAILMAQNLGYDGIICGHIHTAGIQSHPGNIVYMNSGDWVETMSGLVEDVEGNWHVRYYKDLITANQLSSTTEAEIIPDPENSEGDAETNPETIQGDLE
jgi:UDP-2,3-diacylglucosamine pyrophosphatase LpxH